MARFDWADDGTFSISGLSDEEFKAHFNSQTPEQKDEILTALDDQTAEAKDRAAAVAYAERLGRVVLTLGMALV